MDAAQRFIARDALRHQTSFCSTILVYFFYLLASIGHGNQRSVDFEPSKASSRISSHLLYGHRELESAGDGRSGVFPPLDNRPQIRTAGGTLCKAEKTLVLKSKIGGIAAEFSCTGISLDKALLETEGKGTGTALFSGCITRLNGATSGPCEPTIGTEKGKIASKALKGQLVLHEGTTTLAKISAVVGETLAVIESGEECAIGPKVPVIGTLYLKDAGGEFEVSKEAHLLEGGSLTELWTISKTAEHVATPSGSASFSLAGAHLGQPWSGSGSKSTWTIGPKSELPAELSAKPKKRSC
jgi:hypothetical protein